MRASQFVPVKRVVLRLAATTLVSLWAATACTQLKSGSMADAQSSADSTSAQIDDALGAHSESDASEDLALPIVDAAVGPDGTMPDLPDLPDSVPDVPMAVDAIDVIAPAGEVHADLPAAVQGSVRWITSTHIVVTYDWSSDAQLADWGPVSGATLIRNPDNTVAILQSQPDADIIVAAMMWKFPLAVTRIAARAKTLQSNHINVYTNLWRSWQGENWAPTPAIGIVRTNWIPGAWIDDGQTDLYDDAPKVENDVWYDMELTISPTLIRAYWSDEGHWRERPGTYAPLATRAVALGAYQGDSVWGTVVIEGDLAN